MSIKIALAGNPNSGKTTLFNALTGSNQYVGNWPGVTVEKKEGKLRGNKDVIIQDLPGIYSLSPYTLEEVVARNYLVNEKPDAILNIVDGTNIERNLYLTTQLLELGMPVVIAVNMMDLVRKNGDRIDIDALSRELHCKVIEVSALKNENSLKAAELAVEAAKSGKAAVIPEILTGEVGKAVGQIEESLDSSVNPELRHWYAVKLFERDEKVLETMPLSKEMEAVITAVEDALDDDSESIITNERYNFIAGVVAGSVQKKAEKHALTPSDKVDQIVTNRILGIPIFLAVMFFIYAIAMGNWPISIGTMATDWTNDVLFGEIVPGAVDALLAALSIGEGTVLYGLIQDGIIAGVGAVIGFVPQMLVLFLMLSILEDIGYMARVAFVMDRLFRQFGLSGKSFIPVVVASGCGVPGIMASRTIEQDRDRKMTIMTTTFIPCGAKLPIIGLIAGAVFGSSPYVAVSCYFLGIASIILSGIMLKKFKAFAGEPAPFVMELPPYHVPSVVGVLRTTWERGWSFIKRAGSVIVISSIILWFLQAFGFENGFGLVEDQDHSLLAAIGNSVAWIFAPLGFGNWKATVATVTGLIAKENVVGTFAVLYHFAGEISENGEDIWSNVAADYSQIAAYSFMAFNLLCAPCFAAMGAIKREMNNPKWTLAAIGYMCLWAYVVAMIIYNIGGLLIGEVGFGIWTVVSIGLLAGIIYLLFRKGYVPENGVKAARSVDAKVQ